MVAEVVVGEFGKFVGFADIDRDPFAISQALGPAMIAANYTVAFVGGNGESDGEARGNANRAGERNE